MKSPLIIVFLFIGIVFGSTFTTKDPPMIYIYHLANYDLLDSTQISNQRFLSAMVTTSVANFDQIKIAGESLQERIKDDNFLNLFKSSKYPENTDYILIEEINSIGDQFEIDLKLLDISTQDVISSEYISLQGDLVNLRQFIEYKVQKTLINLLKPFSGNIFIKVDQSSENKIRWDYIAIRPTQTLAQGKVIKTTDKDYKIYSIIRKLLLSILQKDTKSDMLTEFFSDYPDLITKKDLNNIGLIIDNLNHPKMFLEGEYILRAYLKNNESWFETRTNVLPGKISEVYISLPYTPPPVKPPPPPPPSGTIVIKNIQDGVESVLVQMMTHRENKFSKDEGQINIISDKFGDISYKETSIILENLPLGDYNLYCSALSNSTFPGKHFTIIYSFKDQVSIRRNKDKKEITLTDINDQSGREIVIYLHPFIPNPDEEYLLFLQGSDIPFSRIKDAGEIHVIGVNPKFNGNFVVSRDGYKDASVQITSGSEKLYTLANLSKK